MPKAQSFVKTAVEIRSTKHIGHIVIQLEHDTRVHKKKKEKKKDEYVT